MARIFLVRHGKSVAGFDAALDSDLMDLGKEQSGKAACLLQSLTPPIPIISSPMLRAKQSAEPLGELWRAGIEIASSVTEIPCPIRSRSPARRSWLNHIMKQRYGGLGPDIENWRSEAIGYIRNLPSNAVIFTHFLTINAIVGLANGDERVVVFDPGYCAITEIDVEDGIARVARLDIKSN